MSKIGLRTAMFFYSLKVTPPNWISTSTYTSFAPDTAQCTYTRKRSHVSLNLCSDEKKKIKYSQVNLFQSQYLA